MRKPQRRKFRKKLIVFVFIAFFALAPVSAEKYPAPRAIAKFCDNRVESRKFRKARIAKIRAEGCAGEIAIVRLEDDFVLIYAVRAAVGETILPRRR